MMPRADTPLLGALAVMLTLLASSVGMSVWSSRPTGAWVV